MLTVERRVDNVCNVNGLRFSRTGFCNLVLFVLLIWNLSVILAVSLCTRVKVMQAGRLGPVSDRKSKLKK